MKKNVLFAAIPMMLLFTGCSSLYTQEAYDDIQSECDAKVDDYESDIEDYEDQIDELETQIADYEAQKTALEEENEDYYASIEMMSEVNDELSASIEELDSVQVSNSSDYEDMYAELAAMAPDNISEDLFVIGALIYVDTDNYMNGQSSLDYNEDGLIQVLNELDSSSYSDEEMDIYDSACAVMEIREDIIANGSTTDQEEELSYATLTLVYYLGGSN